ncbi:carbohydrate-binding module family 13 protein [Polyporus arcularius HHB13444]|uniref:Carbohydrate-binding module family 13 protein n=1 Tax=Polyporus arcularius HHB13444 TaxID=1314778 RepID=A0A5C3PBD8_9APHY|nr:carbohydrate-binding module family 13 protein [Polyporus arcularius HHB13444]
MEKSGDERSPEPNTTQVQGYDTQDVPHVLNSNPVGNDVIESNEQRDLEAGIPTVLGSFEVEEPETIRDQPLAEPSDTTRTPRVEPKTEESLAPLNLSSVPSQHAAEASDATAVAISPRDGTPPVWTPGTYVLLNAQGGTAVDLSGADNKTVFGYPMHGGPNQQWEFIPTGHGYIIRCVRRSAEGHSLYLTTDGSVKHGAAIVASPYPVAWNVEPGEDGIRIHWPNSEYSFDLADWGNSTAGTKIQLAHRREEPCQLWHYTRCAAASESDKDKALTDAHSTSARAVSPPATTETITIAEEDNYVTTTRTTTTTVITTMTEITRTPKSMLRQPQPQRRSVAYR